MKDTTGKNEQNRRRKPRGAAFEIGVIRVSSRPGPDAQDRLRRHPLPDGQVRHQETGQDAHVWNTTMTRTTGLLDDTTEEEA